jgi:hypothetical protein
MGTRVALAQGFYYLASGLWPVLHLASFMAVTGPKTDYWLVQSFGVLIAAVGIVLSWRGVRGRVDQATRQFGLATSLALAAIDFWFVFDGAISTIYLADGVAEAALAVAWLWPARGQPKDAVALSWSSSAEHACCKSQRHG